jgi:hypothetical protein
MRTRIHLIRINNTGQDNEEDKGGGGSAEALKKYKMHHLTGRVRLPVDLAGTPESQLTGRNTDPAIGNFFVNKRSFV